MCFVVAIILRLFVYIVIAKHCHLIYFKTNWRQWRFFTGNRKMTFN